jgi:hypothetical protein
VILVDWPVIGAPPVTLDVGIERPFAPVPAGAEGPFDVTYEVTVGAVSHAVRITGEIECVEFPEAEPAGGCAAPNPGTGSWAVFLALALLGLRARGLRSASRRGR